MQPIGFDGVAEYIATHKDEVRSNLATYFSVGGNGYTGRWFEYFSAKSDPMHLDANDVAAAATLSVPLDGKSVSALFARADAFDALLAQAPGRDVTLWDVDASAVTDDAPLSQAYELLKTIPNIGYVTASKLLACKRPHLVPIRDSVVEQVLGAGDKWWGPWREMVSSQDLRDLVKEVTPTEVPAGTSILRRLDLALWMAGSKP